MSKQTRTIFPPKIEELYRRIAKNTATLKRQRVTLRELKKHLAQWQRAKDSVVRYPLGDVVSVGWDEFIADKQKMLRKLQFENYELNQRQRLMKEAMTDWYWNMLNNENPSKQEIIGGLIISDPRASVECNSGNFHEVFEFVKSKRGRNV